MNKNFLTEKIENARELSFGDIFDQSIELFKKVWLQGFLKSLLQGVIGFIVSIIAYIPLIIVLGFLLIIITTVPLFIMPTSQRFEITQINHEEPRWSGDSTSQLLGIIINIKLWSNVPMIHLHCYRSVEIHWALRCSAGSTLTAPNRKHTPE